MKRISLAILAALLTMASTSFAATTATGTNTVAPTLLVKVNVQKAVSLTLLTGTTAPLHCTVAAGADYIMDFGTVDALGVSGGNCNSFAPATPGVSDAVYWSDYQLLPVYTSQDPSAASTITARVTTNFGVGNLAIVRDTANSNTLPAGVGDFSAMGVASADTIASTVASGTALTRFIGVQVAPTNAPGLTGPQSATVTFTLTVQ